MTEVIAGSGSLVIDHGIVGGRRLVSAYGHMWNPGKYATVGASVSQGQRIGDVGSAGVSSGPHVDLRLNWGGVDIDPVPFLRAAGVDIVREAKAVTAKQAPATCVVYTGARTGLKGTSSLSSSTTAVLAPNTRITIRPGLPVDHLVYATSTPAGAGWVEAALLNPVKGASKQPTLSYASGTVGKRITPRGSAYLFDYPTSSVRDRGILDTIVSGTAMRTTGRLHGTFIEVTAPTSFGTQTGWVQASLTAALYVPTTFGRIAAGKYVTRGAYSIYSSPTSETNRYFVTFVKVQSGATVQATGRTHGSFMEVTYGASKGWMFQTVLGQVYTPKSYGTIARGSYVTRGAYSIYSTPTSETAKYAVTFVPVPRGATVRATGRTHGSFMEVTYGASKGWMFQTVLEKA